MIICRELVISIIILFTGTTLRAQNEVDLLITGAKVFLDNEFKDLDVAIKGEKIIYVGDGQRQWQAKDSIDGSGLILSPGFIDPHTHLVYDLSSEDHKTNLPYLLQGVTTIVTGNDGTSPVDIGDKLKEWEEAGIGTNAALLIGHGSVRKDVMGFDDVQPTAEHLDDMRALISTAMEEGAFGISTGLFYSPGSYSRTEEIIELAKVAKKHDGIYDTHLRDESSYTIGLIKSIGEVLEIAEEAEIPVHISHIKALGKDVWGKSEEVIKIVEDGQKKGLEITANQYPYPASRTGLISAVIPRWAENGGYLSLLERLDDNSLKDSLRAGIRENIRRRGGPETLIFSSAKDTSLNGRSLGKIARSWELSPVAAVIKAVRQDDDIRVVSYNMTDQDINNFMQQDWVITGSDGTSGHPRKYGSFSRKMRKFYKEDGIIDLPFLLHNQTARVAEIFGIEKRGKIKEGYYADLILFDPEEVKDNATFDEPSELASGMFLVLVNGEVVVKNGKFTGELAGKSLRKNSNLK